MKIRFKAKKNFFQHIKIEIICFLLLLHNNLVIDENCNKKITKIALCTMGKYENLYVKEFIDYYFKIGIDHIL